MTRINEGLPSWSLRVDASDDVCLSFDGRDYPLGSKQVAFRYFERFLEDAGHPFTPRIHGRTFDAWDARWEEGGPLTGDVSRYTGLIGLYRFNLRGTLIYLGKAVELKERGLRKRLRDYTRPNDSGRKRGAGPFIYENRFDITFEVLITGRDEEAVLAATQLEPLFIAHLHPTMNKVGRKRLT